MKNINIKTYCCSRSIKFCREIEGLLSRVSVDIDGIAETYGELENLIDKDSGSIVICDISNVNGFFEEEMLKYAGTFFIFVYCSVLPLNYPRDEFNTASISLPNMRREFYFCYFNAFHKQRILNRFYRGEPILDGMLAGCERVIAEITQLLNRVGMPTHIKGYKYLKAAIFKGIFDMSLLDLITKRLYIEVAREFNTTGMNIERSIRNAIDITEKYGKLYKLGYGRKNFDIGDNKPTNSWFIGESVRIVSEKIFANNNGSSRI